MLRFFSFSDFCCILFLHFLPFEKCNLLCSIETKLPRIFNAMLVTTSQDIQCNDCYDAIQ